MSKVFVPSWKLDRRPGKEIVEGMIPETGVGILYAESTAGKSLIALKLGITIINGIPFFGHATVKGDVVMALGEGQAGAGKRLEALIAESVHEEPADVCSGNCTGKECRCTKTAFLSEDGLFYYMKPFPVWDPAQRRAFISQLKAVGDNLRLVILDTLTLFAYGKSLEYPTPAGVVMTALKEIAEELGIFILAIHHTTKTGKTFRGAQVLFDAADVVIRVENGVISNEKQKEGELFDPVDYEIVPVWWVDSETGERVTSAYVKEPDPAEQPVRTPPRGEDRPLPVINITDTSNGRRGGVRTYTKAESWAGGIGTILFIMGFIDLVRYMH